MLNITTKIEFIENGKGNKKEGDIVCTIDDGLSLSPMVYHLPNTFSLEIRNVPKLVPDFLAKNHITINDWSALNNFVQQPYLVVAIYMSTSLLKKNATYCICSQDNVEDFKKFFKDGVAGLFWYLEPFLLTKPPRTPKQQMQETLKKLIGNTCDKITQINFYDGFMIPNSNQKDVLQFDCDIGDKDEKKSSDTNSCSLIHGQKGISNGKSKTSLENSPSSSGSGSDEDSSDDEKRWAATPTSKPFSSSY